MVKLADMLAHDADPTTVLDRFAVLFRLTESWGDRSPTDRETSDLLRRFAVDILAGEPLGRRDEVLRAWLLIAAVHLLRVLVDQCLARGDEHLPEIESRVLALRDCWCACVGAWRTRQSTAEDTVSGPRFPEPSP